MPPKISPHQTSSPSAARPWYVLWVLGALVMAASNLLDLVLKHTGAA